MDLSKLNQALSNFDNFRYNNTPVESHTPYGDHEEGFEVYKIDDDYVKLIFQHDSYGGGKVLTGINFVRPREVSYSNFETI